LIILIKDDASDFRRSAQTFSESNGAFVANRVARRRLFDRQHDLRDPESIEDPAIRPACEMKTLHLARNCIDRAANRDVKRLRAPDRGRRRCDARNIDAGTRRQGSTPAWTSSEQP
jgi:hypothetical protein